jgi:hypothetical protein|tara:strand:+ start:4275 stop:4649 length:375 start_codon:yes stop_codon:yes gene_type:complete
MELKYWLNSINLTKENILDEDPTEKYPAFVVNKCMSGSIDSVLFANEMNKYHFLDSKLQYDFLLNSLRKRKRFAPWLKKGKVEDIDAVKKYYGYSNEKAQQALRILTKEQIKYIKGKLNTGGVV